jgi:hypothetical protein
MLRGTQCDIKRIAIVACTLFIATSAYSWRQSNRVCGLRGPVSPSCECHPYSLFTAESIVAKLLPWWYGLYAVPWSVLGELSNSLN